MGAGSFATTALYRLPRGELWLGERPNCNLCGHQLYLKDFMPLFSYFTHKGKCRYCGGAYQMELEYFLTELFITLVVVGNYLFFGLNDLYVSITLLMIVVIVMLMADYLNSKIHPKLLLSFILLAAIYRSFHTHTILDWVLDGGAFFFIGAALRYGYFTLQGQQAIGEDFLNFSPTNRFNGPLFDRVLLLMGVGIWLGHTSAFVALLFTLAVGYQIRKVPLGMLLLVTSVLIFYGLQ